LSEHQGTQRKLLVCREITKVFTATQKRTVKLLSTHVYAGL
jgi:16S rRNA C1402 (ribose-2'-O) methylase RsmI